MFLTKIDRSVVLVGHDFASRRGLPRRLEVIDFGTLPRKCSRHVGVVQLQLTCKCTVIVLLFQNVMLQYCTEVCCIFKM
jgi:hypothetical protein